MAKELIIHTTQHREFHITEQEDGDFMFQIVMGDSGRVIANPVVPRAEVGKLTQGLVEMLKGQNG